jgi:molecular chaperone DnaK (HSP70)
MHSASARYIVGIDLGTTNCAVAYVDLASLESSGEARVQRFEVPQLVAPGEMAPRETLPSFAYLPGADERESGTLDHPWQSRPVAVVGAWARDHGALVPSRLVLSAKSWLSHGGVDRRARLLPWDADESARSLSPVEAAAAYLTHIREAWDQVFARGGSPHPAALPRQDVVLTVPASFDEEGREPTVEAARPAGFERFTLIEEPSAALYAWIAAHVGELSDHVRPGDRVLVCDVGGGTSDFTLVTVTAHDDELVFERTMVGEHLLLGGDNVDLALARLVERKLGNPRLSVRQRQALRRLCAAAKETLLGPPGAERVPVSVLGSGSALVGGTLTTEVTREEVLGLLDEGFLPLVDHVEGEPRDSRAGLRELGLPYASDPAVTRHLGRFLQSVETGPALQRPNVVLFNGGFFTPPETRSRVVEQLRRWFHRDEEPWEPRVLSNRSPATAVAEGAAYSGVVRRGHGVRIGGGSPRSFYLGVRAGAAEAADAPVRALCVLPRGTAEGVEAQLEEPAFTVTSNRPLAFSLFSSLTRRDALGAVVEAAPDDVHRHAPLVTELRYGKRSRHVDVRVTLQILYTELGTLELWLVSRESEHRWRLQFQLRRAAHPREGEAGEPRATAMIPDAALAAAGALIRETFSDAAAPDAIDTLMARLEALLGFGKHAWPVQAIRPLADLLLELAERRRAAPRVEARWLNSLGFCLRPGFGATLDDWRMTQARRVYLAGLAFPNDVQCQAEWLVLWQRLAGGLSAGQQQELHQRYAPTGTAAGGRRAKRLNPQVERETWRLLASLERLPATVRARLGADVLDRWRREPANASLVWSLGRIGARVSFHGPLNTVVPPALADGWVTALLGRKTLTPEVASSVVQIAACTGDPALDLPEGRRREAHDTLLSAGHDAGELRRLLEPAPVTRAESQRAYGESLPEGLRLEG